MSWTDHLELSAVQVLPVPRLEMIFQEASNCEHVVFYRMVYRHFLGHCVGVPLGETKVSGSAGVLRFSGLSIPILPVRDGAHIKNDMIELGFRGFVCFQDRVWEIGFRDGILTERS